MAAHHCATPQPNLTPSSARTHQRCLSNALFGYWRCASSGVAATAASAVEEGGAPSCVHIKPDISTLLCLHRARAAACRWPWQVVVASMLVPCACAGMNVPTRLCQSRRLLAQGSAVHCKHECCIAQKRPSPQHGTFLRRWPCTHACCAAYVHVVWSPATLVGAEQAQACAWALLTAASCVASTWLAFA